jgi:DNA-binding MarR family transcriptional regulator
MSQKEFVSLIEQNIMILDRLGDRLKNHPAVLTEYPRQHLTALVRLHIGGRAKLKDIARREFVPTSNLCAMFRHLERDGLVLRTIDENDRRNTWYSVTESGSELAKRVIEGFRISITDLFSGINHDDEIKLTNSMKTINQILTNMESESEKN